MDVVSLLKVINGKNRALKRFLDVSTAFLGASERGDLSGLQKLQCRRDAIIRALELFDRRISAGVATLVPTERTESFARDVREALTRKDALIHDILAVDLKIISLIDSEKNEILRQIAMSRKQRDTFSKFKSAWMPEPGDGLDGTL